MLRNVEFNFAGEQSKCIVPSFHRFWTDLFEFHLISSRKKANKNLRPNLMDMFHYFPYHLIVFSQIWEILNTSTLALKSVFLRLLIHYKCEWFWGHSENRKSLPLFTFYSSRCLSFIRKAFPEFRFMFCPFISHTNRIPLTFIWALVIDPFDKLSSSLHCSSFSCMLPFKLSSTKRLTCMSVSGDHVFVTQTSKEVRIKMR